jgi:6,7-dimethyl-8-ribityllumazine synthase
MNPVRNNLPRRPSGRASAGGISNGVKNIKSVRIGIIGSSFCEDVTSELEKRCIATLKRRGVKTANIHVFRVPGSMEIPLIAKKLAAKREYDALITFGAIVKGKTYHFEQIANECARGCMDVALRYEIPVIFEVLAVYDIADAVARATRKSENKGVEAAYSALAMITLMSDV